MASAWKPYVVEMSERVDSIGRVVTVRGEMERDEYGLAVAFERDNTDGDTQWAIRNVNGRLRNQLRRALASAVGKELREHPVLTSAERAEKIAAAEAWARTEAPWLLDNRTQLRRRGARDGN